MIRLNDINKTVIEEVKIKCYGAFNDSYYENGKNVDRESISVIFIMGGVMIHYESKEARDKDIELLDKIFDVKSIEYKAMSIAKPELYSNGGGINEESEPVKEEHLTWKEVKRCATSIKAKMPNGETRVIRYDDDNERIHFVSIYGDTFDGYISDEDLFNALMLKRVE